MRILFLGDCPFIPTSLGKITYYLTRGLLEKGYEVYNTCPFATVTIWENGIVYLDPATNLQLVALPYPGSLKPLIKHYKPDMILMFGTPYAPPLHEALAECPDLGAPCVGYFDNESLHVIPEYALHAANTVMFAAPTEFARHTLSEGMILGGVPRDIVEERTRTVYHGVDVEYYEKMAREADPIFGDNRFTFTMFSKNHIRKNVGALMEAYAMLGQEIIDKTRLFLALIGFGGDNTWDTALLLRYVETAYNVRLKDSLYELTIQEKRVGIAEHQVASIYRSSQVFVFPSEGEAFGLPPVEAALFEIPVIITKHPALIEIWSELPEICMVPAKPYLIPQAFKLVKPDVEKLSQAMHSIYTDEKLRRRVAKTAKQIARRYHWKRMVDEMEKLIQDAAEPGLKPMNAYMA